MEHIILLTVITWIAKKHSFLINWKLKTSQNLLLKRNRCAKNKCCLKFFFQKSLKIGIKWKLIWLTETNIILIYHRNTLNHCLCDQRLSTRHWNSRANELCKIALDMSFSALESSKIGDRCWRGFMLVTTLRCWWLVLYISKVTYVMILSPTNCHH